MDCICGSLVAFGVDIEYAEDLGDKTISSKLELEVVWGLGIAIFILWAHPFFVRKPIANLFQGHNDTIEIGFGREVHLTRESKHNGTKVQKGQTLLAQPVGGSEKAVHIRLGS